MTNHQRINRRTENRFFQKLLKFIRPEGLRCPHCGQQDGFRVCRRHRQSLIPDYRCPRCHRLFSAWTGTELQRTHHPPSELWRFIKGIARGESTTKWAQALDCQRRPLARLRRRLLPRIVQFFGPLPKKSAAKKR
jgi:transposase-like protein